MLFLGRDVRLIAAFTLARFGDVSRAKPLAEELEKHYPTLPSGYWLPTINISIKVRQNDSHRALADLEALLVTNEAWC